MDAKVTEKLVVAAVLVNVEVESSVTPLENMFTWADCHAGELIALTTPSIVAHVWVKATLQNSPKGATHSISRRFDDPLSAISLGLAILRLGRALVRNERIVRGPWSMIDNWNWPARAPVVLYRTKAVIESPGKLSCC